MCGLVQNTTITILKSITSMPNRTFCTIYHLHNSDINLSLFSYTISSSTAPSPKSSTPWRSR
ncbi:hypothetical protein EON63_05350 [archaeon]|nr:MAG: hypothetical protein EON63_05350 [archaeon]